MVIAMIAISMDIELLSAYQSLCGHLISLQREITMDITTITTIILSRVITTIRNMDTFLRTALEHTLVATTIGG